MEMTDEFVYGFVTGEGCFSFGILYSKKKIKQIVPYFSLTSHLRDKKLLYRVKEQINCGLIGVEKNRPVCCLKVTNIADCDKLIKFFDNNLMGYKKIDFDLWKIGIEHFKRMDRSNITKKDIQFFRSIMPRTRGKTI